MVIEKKTEKKGGEKTMMIRKRKAQSVLEYTLILSAIIAAIIAAGPRIRQAVEKGFNDSSDTMENSTSEFKNHLGKKVNSGD